MISGGVPLLWATVKVMLIVSVIGVGAVVLPSGVDAMLSGSGGKARLIGGAACGVLARHRGGEAGGVSVHRAGVSVTDRASRRIRAGGRRRGRGRRHRHTRRSRQPASAHDPQRRRRRLRADGSALIPLLGAVLLEAFPNPAATRASVTVARTQPDNATALAHR